MSNLPQRPQQHVIDTNTEIFCRSVIPSEWIAESQLTDYGIDLEVEIAKNNQVLGAHFLIQLKGTDHLKIRKNTYIAHSCETRTLNYFLERPELFIYLVYDNQKKVGYWIWIQDYLRNELEKGWQNQITNTIRIPKRDVFNDSAIKIIEQRVISHHLPSKWLTTVKTLQSPFYDISLEASSVATKINFLPKYFGAQFDKPLISNLKFNFDKTSEAQDTYNDLIATIKTGEPSKIPAKFISSLEFSDEIKAFLPDEMESYVGLELLSFKPDKRLLFNMQFLNAKDEILQEVPFLELVGKQIGTEEVSFSNEKQNLPLKIILIFNRNKNAIRFKIDFDFKGKPILDVDTLLQYQQALINSSFFVLSNLENKDKIKGVTSEGIVPPLDLKFSSLVKKLLFIQEKLKTKFIWSGMLFPGEEEMINDIYNGLLNGQFERYFDNKSFSQKIIKLQALAIREQLEKDSFEYSFKQDNLTATILGKEIALGSWEIRFPVVTLQKKSYNLLTKIENYANNYEIEFHFIIKRPGAIFKLLDRKNNSF